MTAPEWDLVHWVLCSVSWQPLQTGTGHWQWCIWRVISDGTFHKRGSLTWRGVSLLHSGLTANRWQTRLRGEQIYRAGYCQTGSLHEEVRYHLQRFGLRNTFSFIIVRVQCRASTDSRVWDIFALCFVLHWTKCHNDIPMTGCARQPLRFFLSLFSDHHFSFAFAISSLHTLIHAILISRLNSCTGFKNASFEDKRIWDVFSVCKVKPSGTVIVLSVVILSLPRIGKETKERRKGPNTEVSVIDVMEGNEVWNFWKNFNLWT